MKTKTLWLKLGFNSFILSQPAWTSHPGSL